MGTTDVIGTKATHYALLRELIEQKRAKVGVIGLGYVGLPLSLLFVEAGFMTTGFDVDDHKISRLTRGDTYLTHIPTTNISRAVSSKRFRVTSQFQALRGMDAIIMCVPTPLDDHRQPDLSFIQATAEAIRAELRPGQLVVLESTTYPGTTEDYVLPILQASGLRCPPGTYNNGSADGKDEDHLALDFFLAYSPEREDPGNQKLSARQVPKVIGGPSARVARALYDQAFERTVLVSSSRAAEMAKLLENIYRCVNIALVNELKQLCQRYGH